MSDELKPCPACESDDVGTTYPDRGRCHVFCGDCGMRGPSVKTVEEADAAWNALPRKPAVGPATKQVMAILKKARGRLGVDDAMPIVGDPDVRTGITVKLLNTALAELEADA